MDDYRDTPGGAGPLGALAYWNARGVLERAGDRDVFSVALIRGLAYEISGFAEAAEVDVLDRPAMRLLSPDLRPLAAWTDGTLTLTAAATGAHFLTVSAGGPDPTGLYGLSITPGTGGAGDDRIGGTGFGDAISGNLGGDVIRGRAGDDILWGDGQFALGGGDDRLFGGTGRDILYGDAGRDAFDGGQGDDTYGDVTAGEIVRERPGGGDDIVFYDGESYVLPAHVERLSIWASSLGRDAFGNALGNGLYGNGNDNRLFGRRGDDAIDGEGGDDLLVGGRGADRISGGPGEDLFRFRAPDSPTRSGDAIVADYLGVTFEGAGAAGGDRIDLSRIDADPDQPGRQALSFATGSGPGQVWAVDAGASTLIRADRGGPLGPEITIRIEDGDAVAAADYAPADFIL